MAVYTVYSNQGTPNVYFDGKRVGKISNGILEVKYEDLETGVTVTLDGVSGNYDTNETVIGNPYLNLVTGSFPSSSTLNPLTDSFGFSFDVKKDVNNRTTHYSGTIGNVVCLPNSSVTINYTTSTTNSYIRTDTVTDIDELSITINSDGEFSSGGDWSPDYSNQMPTNNSFWAYYEEKASNGSYLPSFCIKFEKLSNVWYVAYESNNSSYYRSGFVYGFERDYYVKTRGTRIRASIWGGVDILDITFKTGL